MEFDSYASFWDQQASTPDGALAAVDGSASEEIVQRTGTWTARQIQAALALDGGQKVLELGCGVGRIGRELAPQCAGWTGVDISAAMIAEAKLRTAPLSNVDFMTLTRTSLEGLDADSFDRAYSVAVLCHMDKEDLFLYLQEIKRVLKAGAWCYLETWNLAHPIGWQRWRFEVDQWAKADHSQRKNVARNQFCTPDEFSLYLQHAGLTPLRSWAESPWIQVVAGNAMDSQASGVLQQQLVAADSTIAYSQQWGELFGELLDVIYGLTPPGQMLSALEQRSLDDEVGLFKAYLLALWRQGEAHWGPPPS